MPDTRPFPKTTAVVRTEVELITCGHLRAEKINNETGAVQITDGVGRLYLQNRREAKMLLNILRRYMFEMDNKTRDTGWKEPDDA